MREAVWHADGARQIAEGCRLTRLDKRKKNLRCLVGRLNPASSSAIAGSSRWRVVRRHRRWFRDGFFCFCQSRRYSSRKGANLGFRVRERLLSLSRAMTREFSQLQASR
ncbi:hypothetical protein D9M72_608780 [compost metagenome]